jgi:hypothetical protein
MVTTVFYDSYDEEEEEVTEEQGEDTDCEDPEYGNPDLKYMKHQVQQYPRVTQEDTYDKIMMKYYFRCYGCKSKVVKMINDDEDRSIC